MNDARADRWRRVEALFHEAGALVPAERAAFLKDACGGDAQLESDVNALLAVVSEAEGFLETNGVSVVPADSPTGTLAGQQIGPYAVKALVGAGGMGEVYRATDTRLGRDVAMKVLHGSASADPARLRRFEQEARAAAALNHPNILAVFDVGTHEGVPYLISELLEGTTLRQLLDDAMLSAEHTRDYATQIASGLAAAHDKKIVHRDVKPANVFVTSDGRVKLLDFGVVKLTERDRFPGARLESTAPGVLVGTAAYMSPEQVRGDAVDHRSDVFSFGAVLYEMVTGSPAFERRTAADTLSAVLNEEPSYECADGTPATGRAIDVARRCLDKAPLARFQSCRDLVSALASDAPGATPQSPAGSRRALVGAALVMLLIAALGLAAWLTGRSPLATGASNIHSLAVLPLRVISHTPDDDSLADSMTEALITNLAKISALRVVSRPSVMRYKDTQKTLPQIGRELGVDAIVAGSIEREGLRVRISAQLIHAATDGHLWADTYDRDMRNVLLLQDEVARTIAREIRVTLTPEERSRLASARPVDPEAYQAYVKGRYFWDKRTEASINRSIEYFKQAIDRDPSYAAAYSGLADAYVSLGFSFDVGSLPPHEAIPKAKAAAMRALALDDALAEAHNSLGHMKLHYDWDWPGAETEFRRSLELNPGYAQSHHWYSHFLAASGRLDDSIAEGKRAQELDLLSPTMNLHVGWNALFARRYDEALGEFAKTLELQRDYGLAHSYRGLAFEQQGKYAEALEELHKSARLLEGSVVVAAAIGRVHALAGNRSEARRVLADLRQESTRRFINPFEIALIYVGLGDVDASFEWLETAYRSRSDLLVYLNVDPRLDRLRGDPRFKDLVARVGIPASSAR